MHDLTIAICTKDRCQLLKKTLTELLNQVDLTIPYEILVIDNGSSDSTRKIVAEFQQNTKNLRYVYEPLIGLSQARNRAIKETDSNWIGFIDDDAFPDRNWITKIWHGIQSYDCEAIGGSIHLSFEILPPSFLLNAPRLRNLLGEFKIASADRQLQRNEALLGSNMFIQKRILEEIGGFNILLGRKGSSMLCCEETDLFHKLHKQNYKIWYVANAIVYHFAPKERMGVNHLRKLGFYLGASDKMLFKFGTYSLSDYIKRVGGVFRRVFLHPFFKQYANWTEWKVYLSYLYGVLF